MTSEFVEQFAIKAAKGNNGGEWETHYTEDQKDVWRQFVRDLLSAAVLAERERLTKILSGNSAHGVAMELIYPGQHVTIDLSTGETRLRRSD